VSETINLVIPNLEPRLEWGVRDLGFLPVEFIRPTGVSSWVVRVPGVEREFVIAGEEYAIAMEARQGGDGETRLHPKDESAGPKDIAQGARDHD
jgi:hypothetical protein